ncbi:twin-arginine translocase TatA/TatE family subunit [Aeromonas caviae]
MGLGGIHIWHLLILLVVVVVVVVVVFGSKRLAGAGEDLGTAIRDFRNALRDDDNIRNK